MKMRYQTGFSRCLGLKALSRISKAWATGYDALPLQQCYFSSTLLICQYPFRRIDEPWFICLCLSPYLHSDHFSGHKYTHQTRINDPCNVGNNYLPDMSGLLISGMRTMDTAEGILGKQQGCYSLGGGGHRAHAVMGEG